MVSIDIEIMKEYAGYCVQRATQGKGCLGAEEWLEKYKGVNLQVLPKSVHISQGSPEDELCTCGENECCSKCFKGEADASDREQNMFAVIESYKLDSPDKRKCICTEDVFIAPLEIDAQESQPDFRAWETYYYFMDGDRVTVLTYRKDGTKSSTHFLSQAEFEKWFETDLGQDEAE